MRAHHLLLLLLGFLVGCSGPPRADESARPSASEQQSGAAATPTPDGEYLLATFPASTGRESTYEVRLAPCGAPACPVSVRLLSGTTVVDMAAVEWESIVEQPSQTEQGAALTGVGDPLELHRNISTWQTGEGEDAVATVARSVALGPSSMGLLVHQGGGAEHVKRLHYLFVANGQRLSEAWKGWEGQGMTSSTVDTMDVDGDGNPEILFWRFGSSDGLVSDWSLTVHRWNVQQMRLEDVSETAKGPSLFAIVAGPFATPDAATTFLTNHRNCLPPFQVIRTPERGASGFAVAGITARQPLAVDASRALRACDSSVDVRNVDLGVRRQ